MPAPPLQNQKVFTEHFVSSQHRVYGYIVTLIPNRDDADDVFQETCLVLWDKWSEFDPTRDFVRWACGIAHNVVRNYQRRRLRGGFELGPELLQELADDRLALAPLLEVRSKALSGCLDKLPPEQRELVTQCYLRSHSIQAVAEKRSLTRAAVYLRLQRIRRALMQCVNRAVAEGDSR